MVFSSLVFLFLFLPAVLLLHHAAPRGGRNTILLAASLLFYAWGEGAFALVMWLSIAINWAIGIYVEGGPTRERARAAIGLGVVANLFLLGIYKYANFVVDSLNDAAGWAGVELGLTLDPIALPIGISFITFHALSYLLDVYRGVERAEKNPGKVALYISLFPQLVAGPVVRYGDVAAQIRDREVRLADAAYGVRRFVVGLAKKVLIANTMAKMADAVFASDPGTLSAGAAWAGLAAYTLQIYFDFSGYSDMAIGLGRLFGFKFRENFDHPYIARSVTEFWRRWHISLSTWFRDYLYIPLGGNRGSKARTYFNLWIVFLLCGLWHGASWNFVIWGAVHGFFLGLERAVLVPRFGKGLVNLPAPLAHSYTLAVVACAWVFFRAPDLGSSGAFFKALLGFVPPEEVRFWLGEHVNGVFVTAFAAGIIGSAPVINLIKVHSLAVPRVHQALSAASVLAIFALFFLSAASLAAGTHNPFIYFRF
jgi:alginate O-acetyltransferase complex protein AlgI